MTPQEPLAEHPPTETISSYSTQRLLHPTIDPSTTNDIIRYFISSFLRVIIPYTIDINNTY